MADWQRVLARCLDRVEHLEPINERLVTLLFLIDWMCCVKRGHRMTGLIWHKGEYVTPYFEQYHSMGRLKKYDIEIIDHVCEGPGRMPWDALRWLLMETWPYRNARPNDRLDLEAMAEDADVEEWMERK